MNLALTSVMQRVFRSPVRIELLRVVVGGASKEIWSFDVVSPEGTTPCILRRDPVGQLEDLRSMSAGLSMEAQLMTIAANGGVPVPEVMYVLSPLDELGCGFIMKRIDGETIPRKILREARFSAVRPKLAAQCAKILAAIHRLSVPLSATNLRCISAPDRLEQVRKQYELHAQRRPVFELAIAWLHEHIPLTVPTPQVVHGDFRNGNLIVGPEGICAVLDWELVHRGDPAEDIGWLTVPSWRFGILEREIGGFGTLAEFMEEYVKAGGERIRIERLRFWQVMGSLFWGLTCIDFAAEFRAGDRSVERAAIGRRASEAEIDLLLLIDSTMTV